MAVQLSFFDEAAGVATMSRTNMMDRERSRLPSLGCAGERWVVDMATGYVRGAADAR